jgi:hypothetical protein
MATTPTDIRITDHGSIVLFQPLTTEASTWIDEHVEPGAYWHAGALAVEPRYSMDVYNGMVSEGLGVAGDF